MPKRPVIIALSEAHKCHGQIQIHSIHFLFLTSGEAKSRRTLFLFMVIFAQEIVRSLNVLPLIFSEKKVIVVNFNADG